MPLLPSFVLPTNDRCVRMSNRLPPEHPARPRDAHAFAVLDRRRHFAPAKRRTPPMSRTANACASLGRAGCSGGNRFDILSQRSFVGSTKLGSKGIDMADPKRLLIQGGQVYDHDGNVHKPAVADILIEGSNIVAIGPDLAMD